MRAGWLSRLARSVLRASGWGLVWVVGFGGTLVVYEAALLAAARGRRDRAAAEAMRGADELRKLEVVASRRAEFEAEKERLRGRRDLLREILPSEPSREALAAALAKGARAVGGVEVVRVSLAAGQAVRSSVTRRLVEGYLRAPLHVELRGPLPALLRFPEEVARGRRLVELTGLRAERDGAAFRAELRGWVFLDPGEHER